MADATHVILGTGPIGLATLEALLARGERVRMVNRTGRHPGAAIPADVEVVAGDAAEPGFLESATRGAQVVYQVLNPPLHTWTTQFPLIQTQVLAAAQAAGARLVSLENVYMYGAPRGRVLTEDLAHDALTRKGRVRGAMARELLAAHQAGRVEVSIGRASDYFGPRAGPQSNLGDRVMPAALSGQTARVLGDPDQPHTYTYLPDIGVSLAVLGRHPDAPGQVWHLPNDAATRTTRQLVSLAFARAGRSPVRLRGTPTVVLRALGLVDPLMRELVEMQYEYQAPFVVDSTKIARLGLHATPIQHAVEHTLDTYRCTPVAAS